MIKNLKRLSENVGVEHTVRFSTTPGVLPQSHPPPFATCTSVMDIWTATGTTFFQPVNLNSTAELMPQKLQGVSLGSH